MSGQAQLDVIIVGGGFAGVTAMRELRAAGRNVVLLEGRDRLGGRTWYRKFAGTEQFVEFGGTWFVEERQPRVRAEKERYGIGTILSPTPHTWRMSLANKVRDDWMPVELSDVADFERGLYHVIHDSMRIEFGRPYDQQDLEDLDVSVEAWLDSKALGEQTRAYFSAWVGLNHGCAPAEVSALQTLMWIAGMGHSPWTMGTALSQKFQGGSKALIDAMAADAEADVRLSCPVASIEQSDHGVTVATRGGESFHASTAVVATPLNTWKDIQFSPQLSAGKAEAAAGGHQGHSVKPWALVKGAPDHLASWAWDGGMCWLSAEFEIEEGSMMVGFAHSPDVLDIDDPADVARKVAAFLPSEAEVVRTDGHNWNTDEFSQGTWATFAPGQITRVHSALMASEGRVVFSGADIAPQWMGWIEGAIESGIWAAEKVEELL